MSTASTLRIIADAIEILDNPTPMPPASTLDMGLIDAMVLLAKAGTLEATVGVAKANIDSKSVATMPAPAPARKAKPATMLDSKGRNVALNDYGTPMLSDKGTATKGQRDWQVANGGLTAKQAAKLSMVEASNRRKALTGK
jgi:hypothetical protein